MVEDNFLLRSKYLIWTSKTKLFFLGGRGIGEYWYIKSEHTKFLIHMYASTCVGPGTGVPFHIHGPTFAETIYGRKVQ